MPSDIRIMANIASRGSYCSCNCRTWNMTVAPRAGSQPEINSALDIFCKGYQYQDVSRVTDGQLCHQWFFFSRNIGYLTPEIIHFHYLQINFLDQSIQKTICLILKVEALFVTIFLTKAPNNSATNPCSSDMSALQNPIGQCPGQQE